MKITEVKTKVLCVPLKEPWRIATAVMSRMYATLVFVKAD